jgi:hypothetical protein
MWLLMEINPQEKRPFKFYLSSLPETTPGGVGDGLVVVGGVAPEANKPVGNWVYRAGG